MELLTTLVEFFSTVIADIEMQNVVDTARVANKSYKFVKQSRFALKMFVSKKNK